MFSAHLHWYGPGMDELGRALTGTAKGYADRKGLDPDFLGQPVPIPELPGFETVLHQGHRKPDRTSWWRWTGGPSW